MRLKLIVIGACILLATLSYYVTAIYTNKVMFMSDEMYWISTSRVVQMLWQSDFRNPEWKEYYGFANLNGAKFIYGAGLALTGHTDTSITGVAPETYYRWTNLEPGYFPANHTAYVMLRDARYISALFTALAIALIYVLVLLLGLPVTVAIASAIIIAIHPVTKHVATHAFADGIFLFFQMLLLCSLFWKGKIMGHRFTFLKEICIGAVLAYLISVKVNGALFIPIVFLFTIMNPHKQANREQSTQLSAKRLGIIAVSTILGIVLLHPNFIFYPDYSPLQLMRDRGQITIDHVAYYSRIDPSHVILKPTERIASFVRNSFPLWLGILSIAGACITFLYARQKRPYLLYLTAGFIVTLSVLAYCVFDEPRYFLPILPFIAVLAGYTATIFTPKKLR